LIFEIDQSLLKKTKNQRIKSRTMINKKRKEEFLLHEFGLGCLRFVHNCLIER